MVDELAKKFTELEGRVVSAGEVFEKISNREVSFGMVKDILWQMTNEGGQFYKMQEILTESVSGKMAKLKDAWELMLGSIAEGNNGILSNTLDLLTKLTEKWEILWGAITSIGVAYTTYKAIMMAAIAVKAALIAIQMRANKTIATETALVVAQGAAQTRCTRGALQLISAFSSLSKLGVAGWFGIVVSALTALITYIAMAGDGVDELKDKLDEIDSAEEANFSNSVMRYNILVRKLKMVKDKYGEQAEQTKEYGELIKQINSSYGEYLGNLFSESEAYDNVAKSIDRVRAALLAMSTEQAFQKKLNTINEHFMEPLNEAKDDLISNLFRRYKRDNPNFTKETAKMFAEEIIKNIEDGQSTIDATSNAAKLFGLKVLPSYTKTVKGDKGNLVKQDVSFIHQWVESYKDIFDEMKQHLDGLNDNTDAISVVFKDLDDSYKKLINLADGDSKRKRELEIELREKKLEFLNSKSLSNHRYARQLNEEIDTLKKHGEDWITTAESIRDKIYADKKKNKDGSIIGKSLENLLPQDTDIKKNMLFAYIERLATEWKPIIESLDKYNSYKNDEFTDSDKTEKRRLEDRKRYIEEYLKALGLSTSILEKASGGQGGSKKDKALEDFKERLKLLRDAHNQYKKWNDIEGHEAAMSRVKGSGLFDMLFNGKEPVNLAEYEKEVDKIRQSIADYIASSGSNKDRRQAYEEAVKIILDINYDLDKDSLEQKIKSAEDIIRENIENWDIFKTVREKTGNESLANLLAFGSLEYGENEPMKEFRRKIEEALSLKGSSISFDDIISQQWDEKTLKNGGLAEIVPFINAYKEAQSDLRKNTIETFSELIKRSRDFAAERTEIERKMNEDIQRLKDNRDKLSKSGVDVDSAIRKTYDDGQKAKFSLSFEEFKQTENWVKIFDDLDRVSTSTLNKMLKELENLMVVAPESAEELKEIVEAMRKIRDEKIERNPLNAIAESLSKLKYWNGVKQKKAAGLDTKHTYVDPVTGKITNVSHTDQEIADGQIESISEFEKAINGTIKGLEGLIDVSNQLFTLFEALGAEGLKDITGIISGGLSSAASMGSGLKQSGALFGLKDKALKNLGIVGMGVGAMVGVVSGIASLRDKQTDKAINEAKLCIDALAKSYEMLDKSISQGVGGLDKFLDLHERLNDSAMLGTTLPFEFKLINNILKDGGRSYMDNLFQKVGMSQKPFQKLNRGGLKLQLEDLMSAGVGTNKLTNEELKQREAQYVSLLEQRRQVQEQLRLEEGRKKTDGGKVADYQYQIADLTSKISTFVEDLAKELFGIDFSDWSKQISDALTDAFINGENAAEAFKNVTNGIMKGISNNILKSMVIEPMFDKLQKKLFGDKDGKGGVFETFEDIQNNGTLLAETLKDFFDNEGDKMISASQDFLEAFDKASGGALSALGSDKEGLSQGIAKITEEQADLLISYVNAMRHDLSVIRSLEERYLNEDKPEFNAIIQSQVEQLNHIAHNTGISARFAEEIYTLLHKNIIPGKGFKIG